VVRGVGGLEVAEPVWGGGTTVAGQGLIGRIGLVTTRVRGGASPGEIRVVVEGLPHYYIAYCEVPVAVGEEVLIINSRGARQVDVEPWRMAGSAVDAAPTN
jgi:hypothetical protein